MEGFIVDDDELFRSPVPRILRAQSSSPALLQKQVMIRTALWKHFACIVIVRMHWRDHFFE